MAFRPTAAGIEAEVPELRGTNYEIPSDAFFVSPTGDDADDGRLATPFRTVAHAVLTVPPGSTIVIRHGTYREKLPFISKPVTLQPHPHEEVWLKGSVVVDDWIRAGPIWVRENWPHRFARDSYHPDAIDPTFPYAGFPDMVFVNGRGLRQVGSLAEVVADTFFVDYTHAKLYLGTDPSNKLVEASVHDQAARIGADGTVVRGLGFMHYAGGRLEGMLQVDSSNDVTIENNTFAWASSRGLAMYRGTGAIVRGNTFVNNGLVGYASWRYDDVRLEGNRFAANNLEGFDLNGPVAEPAGAKVTVGKNWIIRYNVFENNKAAGLWLDISNYNTTVVSNRVSNNLGHGIYHEISGRAIIASNLVVENDSGIRLSNSSNVKVFNNTLVRNRENLSIQDDSRLNTNVDDLALGISYVTAEIAVQNNILANNDSSQNPFLWVRDFNSVPLKAAGELISACDNNAYHRSENRTPSTLISWWSRSREMKIHSLRDFHAATGCEENGHFVDNSAESPFFVDERRGDYRLKPDSIAIRAGASLPVDVARALGVSIDERVNLGLLIFDWPYDAVARPTAP